MELPDFIAAPLQAHPWLLTLIALAILATVIWIVDLVSQWLLGRVIGGVVRNAGHWGQALMGNHVIPRAAHVIPAIIFYHGLGAIPGLPASALTVLRGVTGAFIVVTLARALGHLLDAIGVLYEDRDPARAHARPIKGYLQVVKIVISIFAIILIIATLFNRDPLLLLSGLGAMTAVLMLVFKDTILSLVASVQLSSNDMLRVGDWIEMPQLNADGDVVDISLHTVKVQNWDKTITTIPTWRLINESYKNWRGMFDSGGRRIKRALYIDQGSVRFLEGDEREQLRRIALIDEYLEAKQKQLEDHNAKLLAAGKDAVNTRRVTNIGTFRAYVSAYLRAHPQINQGMTQLVRQLQPGATGLPIEIYCFTSTTSWAAYEDIQSDIFDHLYAILPQFGLRVFQEPAGADLAGALAVNRSGHRPDPA